MIKIIQQLAFYAEVFRIIAKRMFSLIRLSYL